MYHWIIITALIELLYPFKKEIYFDLSLYMGTFIITILVSWISFMTFEKFFLNLKKKFEIKL
jgi:peptidoglycan/LPS O-acetylase OafA/YrhL